MIPSRPIKRIVLTGAPGSGKTVISAHLAAAYPDRFALVPEAATQVYAILRTRWDKLDVEGRRDAQRRMYRLQLEQEARFAAEQTGKILLLDRGTIDGAAYWPEGADDFWRDLGSTWADELARYDVAILLETTAMLGLYDGEQSNPCRHEDAGTALVIGDAVRAVWAAHPRLHFVAAYEKLGEKIAEVEAVLREIIPSR